MPNGTVTRAALPFNLTALFDAYVIRSTSWASLTPNGTASNDGYYVNLVGTSPTRNVFTLPAATLQAGKGLRIKVPDGSTTLINVRGGSFQNSFEGGIFLWDEATGYVQLGVTAPNADLEARRKATLWNFPEASSVTLGPPGHRPGRGRCSRRARRSS